jgi:hypothetical protein
LWFGVERLDVRATHEQLLALAEEFRAQLALGGVEVEVLADDEQIESIHEGVALVPFDDTNKGALDFGRLSLRSCRAMTLEATSEHLLDLRGPGSTAEILLVRACGSDLNSLKGEFFEAFAAAGEILLVLDASEARTMANGIILVGTKEPGQGVLTVDQAREVLLAKFPGGVLPSPPARPRVWIPPPAFYSGPSDAYREGEDAGYRGVPVSRNPYDWRSNEYADWNRGHADADDNDDDD